MQSEHEITVRVQRRHPHQPGRREVSGTQTDPRCDQLTPPGKDAEELWAGDGNEDSQDEVLSAFLSFIYEGEAVIKEADTVPFIETAQEWKIRQFLQVKRKKKPENITNQANAGGGGCLRRETAPQGNCGGGSTLPDMGKD